MATEDDRYRQSTQYRLWSFSRAQLAQTREKTNALARTNISERLTQLASIQKPSSTSHTSTGTAPSRTLSPSAADGVPTPIPADQPNPHDGTSFSLPEFLSPAEELQLLNIYTVELIRAAKFCELPEEIRATAAVFLRRFYVTNSIMTYPPTDMLKTALFFGSKAEGNYVRLGK
jgi:cyclin H